MSTYEEDLKKLQAEAWENLQKLLNAPKPDLRKAERRLLGHELAKARRTRKLSQTQLAAKAGVWQPDISHIENGKANPNLNTLLRITRALDTNLVVEYS